jgi:hypothetical protein
VLALAGLAACPGGPETDSEADTEPGTEADTDPDSADPDSDTAACGVAAPTFAVGTGESGFVALGPEDSIPVVCGVQGGWHVVGALRGCDTTPTVSVVFTVVDVQTGLEVGRGEYVPFPLSDEGGCCAARADLWAYLETSALGEGAPPYLLDGRALRLEMAITDANDPPRVFHAASTAVGTPHESCLAR